ncbi:MAG: ABC transporter permease [Bacteroidetes bacterium]|nr:ABC transporter permease [Bacteroidota bacterium]
MIEIEVFKLFSSYRTYITFVIAIILMLIINLGFYNDGEELFDFLLQSISEYFFIEGNIINGYLISYLALNTLWVHIPLLIIIVTAYIFSSEFEYGTIRVLLTQPISRTSLLSAKIVSMILFIICFMIVVALFALVPSVILFDTGDVIVFIDGIQFIQEDNFLNRFFSTILFAIIGMVAFSSMAMYFALWFKNTLTAILISLGLLIVHTLLQKFVFGIFSTWQPFLFTYHISKWQLLFVNDIPFKSILNSVYFLLGMSIFFMSLSYYKFNKLNIS